MISLQAVLSTGELGTGTSIFQFTGTGSLQKPDGANALMRAISSQNLDDTFATTSFIIGNPLAFIHPIGNHAVGDTFTITGSTNLAVGNNLMIEITSSSFKPTQKVQSGEFSGSAGTVRVEPGADGLNRWSFDVDASSFKPDEYIVTVSGETIDVTAPLHSISLKNYRQPLNYHHRKQLSRQHFLSTPSPIPVTLRRNPRSRCQ